MILLTCCNSEARIPYLEEASVKAWTVDGHGKSQKQKLSAGGTGAAGQSYCVG
jgi:hypothetical protein